MIRVLKNAQANPSRVVSERGGGTRNEPPNRILDFNGACAYFESGFYTKLHHGVVPPLLEYELRNEREEGKFVKKVLDVYSETSHRETLA